MDPIKPHFPIHSRFQYLLQVFFLACSLPEIQRPCKTSLGDWWVRSHPIIFPKTVLWFHRYSTPTFLWLIFSYDSFVCMAQTFTLFFSKLRVFQHWLQTMHCWMTGPLLGKMFWLLINVLSFMRGIRNCFLDIFNFVLWQYIM